MPSRAMNPTDAGTNMYCPESHSANTPPINAKGTLVSTSKAWRTERKVANNSREISAQLAKFDSPLLAAIATACTPQQATHDLLTRAIRAEPASIIREGGVIADGYDAELDELRGLPALPALQALAAALADLDVLCTLAERAQTLGYCVPQFSDEAVIEIRSGRHPVVESRIDDFIPNDTLLSRARQMLLITGPNMGGKSTYMRQTALIVLLACCGSFVPAGSARIGPIDQIFTRIGSSDDLAGGRSTFMVEITETAHTLHNATDNSLVLLDEIGRGTSTFDGLALAWAIARQLAEKTRAHTLFATHYFELTRLPLEWRQIANVHVEAVEHKDRIVFLHSVKEGPASQSYGLQVAALAGVPGSVIQAARRHLVTLEQGATRNGLQSDLFAAPSVEPAPHPVLAQLAGIEPDGLSPKAALETLYQLKSLLAE